MDIHNISRLDGAIFYGIVNERLRLECDSLEALMAHLDLDHDQLQNKFDDIGCEYDPLTNQLRLK
ncbi:MULTISPECIES: DUF4250 domain-containing protein [Salinivibrio]|uniref:DUF4250 domain-containing protein n=1 Tax=Salinivibrio kushneri TaxID=1908198 RepID=A0AB36K560_9GAMM|nr:MULTISPECIES: DUF4250 domain-containing protein [Salinivibrio]ODP96672.1 hypothetical protein BGL48_02405 [Salinivibrio sp. BNH]OOE35473.1 hypothetical protein BZG04_08695 [Salinivibrio kushneri]OOE42999.1 hypothetical protein BZG09_11815 [Salinivibrio kushneri]OOE44216.1 hypothetical protein BZG06_09530 [Salinivibrio kushneri]OOE47163.1 hypothetical protein BZG10_13215 [Salinivibrio kushneri]